MAYTNSPLVSYTKLSPNHSGQRTHSIDRITPHCVVGQCSVETLGNIFLPTSRQASSNYGIGVDGRVGMYVEEKNRSWCSSSAANDQRAITIECASDNTEPYAFKDVVYQRLIELCTDICKRNGKTKLLWLGDKAKPTGTIKAGDLVTITGSTYYNGKSIPKWVKEKNWYVLQTNGARVVIDKSEDGKNAICSPVNAADLQLVNAKPGKTVDELACEVIRGLWGNGTERKNRLTEAGYDYRAVQRRVNELLR